MTEAPKMLWQELVDLSETHGLLGLQLYVVTSIPANGLGPILANLDKHVAYQTLLEKNGIMFAAGPLASQDLTEWLGEGLFVYRADSLDEAQELADADPLHRSGARTFSIRRWMLNEGTYSIQVFYSAGIKPQIR